MKLWTWQGKGHSIERGRVDWNRSDYYNTMPAVRSAYRRLKKTLRTDQFIWCSPKYDASGKGIDNVLWELDVPEKQFLAIVDMYIWNRIIERKCGFPASLRNQWKMEAVALFPNDEQNQELRIRESENAFYAPQPKEELWKRLVIDFDNERANILIPFPVKSEWIRR